MKRFNIFDGHNDVLTALYLPEYSKGRNLFEESKIGHIDIPRARKGGMVGGFFAICTPPPETARERNPFHGLTMTANGYDLKYHPPLEFEYSRDFADSVIDFAYALESQSSGDFRIVRTYKDLNRCLDTKAIAAILHIEGAEPVKADLSNLVNYYERGIKSIGLVWSRPNDFGFGVPYRYPSAPDTGPGLTSAGLKLVDACNELKIIIDLAHVNEKGFWDVAARSKQPLVISHTAVHSLCPASRNITDKQIDAVGDSDGIIGVWFEPLHIHYRTDSEGKPISDVPAGEIARHIEYIAKRIGIDHVAIGSDFDGADMPSEISDVSHFPMLTVKLAELGFSESELEKIALSNWLRIIKKIWGE
jgi:membrane dipeptidase